MRDLNPRPFPCKGIALPTELIAQLKEVYSIKLFCLLIRTVELYVHDILFSMKKKEKDKAIYLRKKGISMGEISQQLNVAKSTVSYWVRDIFLSKAEIKKLQSNSHSRLAIERRRASRMGRHTLERQLITNKALEEARLHSNNALWCVAVALYWGEGGKTQRTIRIANSDPAVIKLMMKFFQEFCLVPLSKMRAHVHAFAHTDVEEAVLYWSEVSGIPKKQFYKTYVKNSSSSKLKKNSLPYGTCQIYVHDSVLFITMMAWIEYLKNPKHYD